MTYDFSFWAQNLTNTGDDHAGRNGEILRTPQQGEEVAQKIGQVTMRTHGRKVAKEETRATLYATKAEAVLEVIWAQTDNLGRKAPVVGYSQIPPENHFEDFDNWAEQFVDSLDKFVIEIGRELPLTAKQVAREALSGIKKKQKVAQNKLKIGRTVGASIVLISLLAHPLVYLKFGSALYMTAKVQTLLNLPAASLLAGWGLYTVKQRKK